MRQIVAIYVLMLSLVPVFFASCKDPHEGGVVYPDASDTCDRTVLVYMLGSNTLGGFVESNISAMQRAVAKGALNNGNLLLYIDRYNALPTLERLSFQNKTVERTVVKTYENRNSATVDVMSSVIEDMKELYPAASYGLILWSHANGWYPAYISDEMVSNATTRSFGDDEGKAMNIDDVARAIPDSTFDFILCDACYMGAVEVAYDLRRDCRYYVASPAAIMGGGFPYEKILGDLFSCEKPIPENLIEVCRSYMTYYRSYFDPYATISLVDMGELDMLSRSIAMALEQSTDTLRISTIQQFSQEKGVSISYQNLFFDLDDYVQNVCADTVSYTHFSDCLDRVVLYSDATDSFLSNVSGRWCPFPINRCCGLAAYIPGACSDEIIDTYYKTLSWYGTVYGAVDEMPVIIAD